MNRLVLLYAFVPLGACGGSSASPGADADSDAGVVIDGGADASAAVVVSEQAAPDPPVEATSPASGSTCPTAADPRVIDLTIHSPALGTNVGVRLLVPADWSKDSDRTWPLLFLLDGHGNSYPAWSCSTHVEQYVGDAEVIVVMPDGTSGTLPSDPPDSTTTGVPSWYSDWWNGGKGGAPAWEAFHTRELPSILEHAYRASTTWAIAGLSMGGFGAMSYAARNPALYVAAASYSGADHPVLDQSVVRLSLTLAGQSSDALWGDPTAQKSIWDAHDPTSLVSALVGKPVYVAAGNGASGPLDPTPTTTPDAFEPGILVESQAFVAALTAAGGQPTTDFYGPGTHSWGYWDADLCRSLPMLMSALAVPYTPPPTCPTP